MPIDKVLAYKRVPVEISPPYKFRRVDGSVVIQGGDIKTRYYTIPARTDIFSTLKK